MSQRREIWMPRIATLIFVVVAFCTSGYGRTIHVDQNDPAAFATIQAAVDAASDGDTVFVASGTYTGDGNRDIIVQEKAITVKSEKGPRSCTIDCRDSGPRPHTGFLLVNSYSPTPGMPVVDGFTITGARGKHAGGIYCCDGSPRIVNCIIVGNTADTGGGGIRCEACSDVVIANCIVSGNMAPSPGVAAKGVSASGGGICINGPHVTLTNCLITGNRCTGMGGGLKCGGFTVVNCTISGNSGPTSGGIFGGGSQEHPATIRNSIVCGNTRRDIDCPPLAHLPGAPSPECRIAYSLGGVPSCCKPEGVECPPLDQLFARVDYWDPNGTPADPNDDFWVQGDYHLKSQAGRWDPLSETWVSDDVTSPGIDAGDPNSSVAAEPFPNGGRINMGAYGGTAEASKSPSGLHAPYGGGAGSGRTIRVGNDLSADYPTIQAAIDAADDGDTVLVTPGTYTGEGNRDITIHEKAITVRSEKGARSCIIDCRDTGPGGHTGFWLLNGYTATPGMPVVEGFTITGARGSHAGGIYCGGGSPRIMNCIIVGNAGETGGGGILCEDCADVVIAYCVISGNMTPSPSAAALGVDRSGGGIRINGPHATLINCLITGNRCTGMGGAVASGSITVVNCTISGNSAWASGGIFAGSSTEHPLIVCNSIVCGNTGTDIGRPPVSHIPGDPPADCRITYSLVGTTPFSKPQECPPLDQLFARLGYWDPNGTPDDPNDDFWVQGDYHLKSQAGRWDPISETWVKDDVTSSGIDAGDSNSPVAAESFPNGGAGQYGGLRRDGRGEQVAFGPPCPL